MHFACFCCGTWSSGASQVARSAPCLPYSPSLEAVRGVRLSEAYLDTRPLGSSQETPGRTTDRLTALAHTSRIVLRSSQWRHAHRDVFCRETWSIPLRLQCSEHPGAFPQRTHPYSHPHGEDNPIVCRPKQLQSATAEIKRRKANLVQLGSIPSGQQRKTKVSEKHVWLSLSAWLACWTTHKGTRGIDQRRRRPSQEQPGGRRNLLLHSQIYFWGDKRSKDESRLCWCDHPLSPVMPHDVRSCLDHSLAYRSLRFCVAGARICWPHLQW